MIGISNRNHLCKTSTYIATSLAYTHKKKVIHETQFLHLKSIHLLNLNKPHPLWDSFCFSENTQFFNDYTL